MDHADIERVCGDLLGRCRFPDGPVRLAVSGGADSLALVALAVAHAGRRSVEVFHVDHGLRPESAVQAVALGALMEALGLRYHSVRVEVAPGANLEARAREQRYEAMPADVCTGHTADDLAETVLLNLVRGSGLDGMAAMARRRPGPQRPLLSLRRAETAALCAALGWVAVDDPMNADPRFRRVRIRREVLPLLHEVAERDVVTVLCRQAALAADEADLLDDLASALDPTDALSLQQAPVALARRCLRAWLVSSGVGDGHPLSAACVERVMAVVRGDVPRADLVGGWSVHRRAQRLSLQPGVAAERT